MGTQELRSAETGRLFDMESEMPGGMDEREDEAGDKHIGPDKSDGQSRISPGDRKE
jgi:hypothetical protein